MSPSAPFSIALRANRLLITSCSTIPPYEWIASLTSSRAPREVMTIGTWCSTTVARSSASRSLDLCTMRFTANGATYASGLASAKAALLWTIWSIHSPSADCGRALSEGNAPITPAWHCAATSSGPE